MQDFFNSSQLMPHGMCLMWRTDILALHVLSDGLIALAYFSIPLALIAFMRKRPMLEYRGVLGMFAAFILMCGATHLVSIWTFWNPDYAVQGLVKAATAVISVATAAALWPLLPKFLALPAPSELAAANARLEIELGHRREAEQRYRTLVDELEEVVGERTARLNQSLEALAESERRFRGAFDTASHGRALVALDGAWMEVNPKLCEMLEYSAEELLETNWRGVTHPEDIDRTTEQNARMTSGEIDAYSVEKRYVARSGRVVHAIKDVRLVRDETGRPVCFVIDIRDRSQVVELEALVRKSEARAATVIETAGDAILELHADGSIVGCNPAAQEMFGRDSADLCGRPIASLMLTDSGTSVAWEKLRDEAGSVRCCEQFMVCPAKRVPVPVEVRLGGADAGGHTLLSAVLRDVSERVAAERALRDAHEETRFHMANSPLGVIEWDRDFRITYWSPAAERMFGWRADEVVGRHPDEWRFVHEDDVAQVTRVISDIMLARVERNQNTNRNYHKDGSVVHTEWSNSVRTDAEGNVVSLLSFVENITRRVEDARALVLSEAHTKAILDTAVDGIVSIAPDGIVLSFNPAAERIFGYRAKEVVGREVGMLMPEAQAAPGLGFDATPADAPSSPARAAREVYGRRRSGEEFPMELAVSEVCSGGHRTFTGFVRDISERKRHEREIFDGNRRLQEQDWLLSGHAALSNLVQGDPSVAELGRRTLDFLCRYLGADAGTFYWLGDGTERLLPIASHGLGTAIDAYDAGPATSALALQAARECRPLSLGNGDPGSGLVLVTGFGEVALRHIVAFPIEREETVEAVIELGAVDALHPDHSALLAFVADTLAVALASAHDHERVSELLAASREQAAALEQQREELRTVNADLRERSRTLEEKNRELSAAKQEIEDKAHAVEQANFYKSEFLANMSHELRTPLNSMLVLARSLADNPAGTLSPEDVECAQVILGSGENLLALINDVLDLSKVEAGKLDIVPAVVSIADLLRELEAQFEPIAAPRGLTLAVESEAAPATCVTDPLRLRQILRNLLANAFKFTESGGVTLSVAADGDDRVAFRVADTGIGISADQQARIFEAFAQVDGTTRRAHEGTGLGLSICRKLGHLLHAEITLDSEPGHGSTFTLRLPLSFPGFSAEMPPTSLPLAGARPPQAGEQVLAGVRILVVDDDYRGSFALSHALGARGAVVRIADSGRAALVKLSAEPFDCVLLDLMMPGMDGRDTLCAIRQQLGLRDLPVIAVTASASVNARQDVLAAGACACVSKPVDLNDLVALLRRHPGRAA